VLKSIIASCRRLKINPYAYLCAVLGRIAAHLVHALDQLLSANCKPAAA
jgi:hypothetical protein